jgi:PTS system nitrogen regulatory IIA component
MCLTLSQVAKMFAVSEEAITHWIRWENFPARQIDAQYRFEDAEILAWATANQRLFSPALLPDASDQHAEISLTAALERGAAGVHVAGGDRYEVFRNALLGLSDEQVGDPEALLELFISREKAGGTAIGNGIAIPHPRYPIVMPARRPLVLACYLAEPLAYGAQDGRSVDTLFLMICSSVQEHLALLARLATVLQVAAFRELLAMRPDRMALLAAVRNAELEFSSDSPNGWTTVQPG